ncbi:MAG: hypothetical protein SFT90_08255 [Rickettsiales bacterium]|nr:hypothetical protein [Rickettsiales bacterium]
MKNLLKKTGSIIISLGDEGAILTCFSGDFLENRIFTSSPFSSDVSQFFLGKEGYKVYILLDTIDQNFIFANLPPVGKANIKKIIQRKLKTEFDPSDLNSYMELGKEETKTRKDIKYVFVSIRNSSPLSEWLEFVETIPNVFVGIYLLPIEAEDLLIKLKSLKKVSKKSNDDWDILISQNRVGGFRQVVFKGGKIIFTRISQSLSIQSPDSVGVNISQEALNTLEYIRRIGYTDQKISFFIISAKDSAPYIDIVGINKQDVHHLSPYEISQASPVKNSALENDKFGDVVLAANFVVSKKKLLKLETKEMKSNSDFLLVRAMVNLILNGIIIFLPILTAYLFYSAYNNSIEAENINNRISTLQMDLANVKDFEAENKINPTILGDMIRVNNSIKEMENTEFIDLLKMFRKVSMKHLAIISYTLETKDSAYTLVFRGNLVYNKKDISDIFFKANKYSKLLKKEFEGLELKIDNLPSEKSLKLGTTTQSSLGGDPVITITISATKGQLKQILEQRKQMMQNQQAPQSPDLPPIPQNPNQF